MLCLMPSGKIELFASRRAAAHEDGVEAFVKKSLHTVDGRVVADVYAHVQDDVDLFIEDALRKTERGDVGMHQPAWPFELFEHYDVIAQGQKIIGDGKRCRTRADTGDSFAVLLRGNRRKQVRDFATVVGRHALQPADSYRLAIHAFTPARGFTRPVARSPENRRKNVRLSVEHVRIGIAALGNEANVFRNVGVGGACPLTVHNFVEVIRIPNVCCFHGFDLW